MSTQYSLGKRLLYTISIPVLLLSTIAIGAAFMSAWHEIEEVYDAQLVHSAKVLLQLMEHELVEDGDDENFTLSNENPIFQHKYEKNIAFRIWYRNKLMTQSNNATIFAKTQAPPGFSNQTINNEKWRFFMFIETRHDIRIETSERHYIRQELIEKLMASLVLPLILFIPLLFFVIWRGIRSSLKPVVKLSADVDHRNSDDLSVINDQLLPKEIAPLILAINRLFIRINKSFKREREFTDHAAHELRTPLAAMKTQTQVLQKKLALHNTYMTDIDNLLQSINRSSYLVDQLLLLARLQNGQFPKKQFNLSKCLSEVIAESKAEFEQQNIILYTTIYEHYFIQGHDESVAILIRNLLKNSLHYTPSKGSVSISLNSVGQLSIADTGTGIADKDKQRVFERFVRLDNTGNNGSGLGLSITRWIANAHKARITLKDNHPHGLIVTVDWHQ